MENDKSDIHCIDPSFSSTVNLSSNESMFPATVSASPESTFSDPPPPYSDPSHYPPTYGMPYPQQLSTPVAGYSQSYVPPPGGQPYYTQPGVAYPEHGPPAYYSQTPQPQHHQQTRMVITNDQAPLFVPRAPSVSMTRAIVLSCFAFWCFGVLFGGIAFIVAMVGRSLAAADDTSGAIRMRNASYRISIAGIVLGVILIALFAGILGSAPKRNNSAYYYNPKYNCYGYYYYGYYRCN